MDLRGGEAITWPDAKKGKKKNTSEPKAASCSTVCQHFCFLFFLNLTLLWLLNRWGVKR